MYVYIKKSTKPEKKYMAIVSNGVKEVVIHFGSKPYQDFLQHRDENRKKLYILRHQKNENWNDILTPGFWSRWLLWNKPTLEKSIQNISKKFGIKIKFIN